MTKDEINLRKKFLNDISPVILYLFFKFDFWRLRKGGTSQKVVKLILYYKTSEKLIKDNSEFNMKPKIDKLWHPYRDGLFEKNPPRAPTRKVTDNACLALKLWQIREFI